MQHEKSKRIRLNSDTYLKAIIYLLVFFNAFDAIVTLYVLKKQLGTEINPLMRFLFDQSPMFFLMFKVVVVMFGCHVIWEGRKSPGIKAGATLLTICYLALFIYQVASLFYMVMLNSNPNLIGM